MDNFSDAAPPLGMAYGVGRRTFSLSLWKPTSCPIRLAKTGCGVNCGQQRRHIRDSVTLGNGQGYKSPSRLTGHGQSGERRERDLPEPCKVLVGGTNVRCHDWRTRGYQSPIRSVPGAVWGYRGTETVRTPQSEWRERSLSGARGVPKSEISTPVRFVIPKTTCASSFSIFEISARAV